VVALSSSVAPIRGWNGVKGYAFVRVLRRIWILLVVLMVIGCGGFTVSRVHGIFGSESEPQQVDRARLPWSLKIMTISNEVNAFTHCLVTGA
jgi:hypothetical protein